MKHLDENDDIEDKANVIPNISNETCVCKFCHLNEERQASILSPCLCKGSLEFVHDQCLTQWIKTSGAKNCDICKYTYETEQNLLPIREWKIRKHINLKMWAIVHFVFSYSLLFLFVSKLIILSFKLIIY